MDILNAPGRNALKASTLGVLSALVICCPDQDVLGDPQIPLEVGLNADAGRGDLVRVNLRLESGQELPFLVDTGAGVTCLDTSLESKLGKRVGTVTIGEWGKTKKKNAYPAPKLYLGGIPLKTGSQVVTMNLQNLSSSADTPALGVLGMDVLRHYCVQLDFQTRTLRLLDDRNAAKQPWGRPFPIVPLNSNDQRPAVAENLLGSQGPHSLIDTGYIDDGWLMPKPYQQWTNETLVSGSEEAHLPNAKFGGEIYPQIALRMENVESDGIGLPFLARHLVTLDFPKRTMYLKRTSKGPIAIADGYAAANYLRELKGKGLLPGWTRDDRGTLRGVKTGPDSTSATISILKDSDSTMYHYEVTRASTEGPWRIQRAWRTDQDGKVTAEYPTKTSD